VRDFIETMMEEELDAVLSRPRYGRIVPTASKKAGSRRGSDRPSSWPPLAHPSGNVRPVEVAMPRARLNLGRWYDKSRY